MDSDDLLFAAEGDQTAEAEKGTGVPAPGPRGTL